MCREVMFELRSLKVAPKLGWFVRLELFGYRVDFLSLHMHVRVFLRINQIFINSNFRSRRRHFYKKVCRLRSSGTNGMNGKGLIGDSSTEPFAQKSESTDKVSSGMVGIDFFQQRIQQTQTTGEKTQNAKRNYNIECLWAVEPDSGTALLRAKLTLERCKPTSGYCPVNDRAQPKK